VATIGLSIGVVSQDIYTLIVVMAVATTMVMPPTLRWALKRIPPTGEEKQRLEREEAEQKDFVPKVQRLLIAADQSEDGKLASILGGLFAGSRKIMVTVLNLGLKEPATHSVVKEKIEDWVKLSIEFATRKEDSQHGDEAKAAAPPAQVNTQSSTEEPSAAVLKEVKKGYDMLDSIRHCRVTVKSRAPYIPRLRRSSATSKGRWQSWSQKIKCLPTSARDRWTFWCPLQEPSIRDAPARWRWP